MSLIRIIALVVFCTLVASTPTRAQLTVTGVGGGFGAAAGFTPCAGTVIHTASPNDLTSGWNTSNATPVANATTAPDSTNTASSLTATGANFAAGVFTNATFTMTGSTTYSITGYAKKSVAPNWIFIGTTDFAAFRLANWFDINAGTAGSADQVAGTVSCAKIAASTGGWFQYSVGMTPTST